MVGRSAWTGYINEEIHRIANVRSTVLITGPTGTGKELLSRCIHASGPRSTAAFVAVDCTAFCSELVQSQLFGHLKGAFTGAGYEAMGCFRAAEGGTIFLDEIGDLDIELQSKLLRVIQERVVVPLGANREIPVNVRIIAATNRNLKHDVQAGRFRADLFYRLNVIHFHMPPLNERREDIVSLAEYFLNKLCEAGEFPPHALDRAAVSALEHYDWPGNARQLENLLERAIIDSDGPVIRGSLIESLLNDDGSPPWAPKPLSSLNGVSHSLNENSHAVPHDGLVPAVVPPEMLAACDNRSTLNDHWSTLKEMERRHIELTLEHTLFNRSAAARLLGISRFTLTRKMKQLGIVRRLQPSRPASSSSRSAR